MHTKVKSSPISQQFINSVSEKIRREAQAQLTKELTKVRRVFGMWRESDIETEDQLVTASS